MLRDRLIAGAVLAAAMAGVLVADGYLAPYFPCLFACVVAVGALAARELAALFPEADRPGPWAVGFVVAVLAANWLVPGATAAGVGLGVDRWRPVLQVTAAATLAAFLLQLNGYRGPGRSTARLASASFAVAYLGVLPSFLVQLRWLDPDPAVTGWMLAATIFVPKAGDIGAYFTGRLVGRHRMAPLLSPGKTWEGFAGGMLAAAGTAIGLSFAAPIFRYGWVEAAGFGLAVGLAGVLGDLAESLLKRDAGAKDAARSVPGFGGVLDVVDSVLFAAPVAYWWLSR